MVVPILKPEVDPAEVSHDGLLPLEQRRLHPATALGLSLVCHLLLGVLLFWLGSSLPPLQRSVPPPRERRIDFSFVEPRDLREPGPPAGTPQAPPKVGRPLQLPPPSPAPPGQGSIQAPAAPPASEPAPAPTPTPPDEAAPMEQTPRATPLERRPSPRPSLRRALREFQDPGRTSADLGAAGQGGRNNVYVPDLSQIPQTGFGVGNLVFEGHDFDWTDYGRQIYSEILRAWYRRLWATTDEFERWGLSTRTLFLDHHAFVNFTIERNGQVTGVEVERVSGCPPLDRSAVDALEEVILPPLPKDFPRERETVHAQFIILGELRNMHDTLQAERARGTF
jgi:TonB family protein